MLLSPLLRAEVDPFGSGKFEANLKAISIPNLKTKIVPDKLSQWQLNSAMIINLG